MSTPKSKEPCARGYFVHPGAICESKAVGDGTRIWAFAHVLPGARIGRDGNICDGVFIESGAVIGDRVTVKCGVQIWDGVVIEDDVFVGPNATFTNDHFPRSRRVPAKFERTVVRRGASIGANATILPGVVIGQEAMVGAGAVVTRSVPAHAKVAGNPARIIGYVGARETAATPATAGGGAPPAPGVENIGVAGVTLHRLPHIKDIRGDLSVGEFVRDVPFVPKRYFLVFDVPSEETRGEHAHRRCRQFLVCLKGRCTVVADDGARRRQVILNSPALGLYLPPMTWLIQYRYSPDAVLLVFASEFYEAGDYIRDYEEYLSEIGKRTRRAGGVRRRPD